MKNYFRSRWRPSHVYGAKAGHQQREPIPAVLCRPESNRAQEATPVSDVAQVNTHHTLRAGESLASKYTETQQSAADQAKRRRLGSV